MTVHDIFLSFVLFAAYVNGVVVGAMCCRIEPPGAIGARERLYIMTLGVLATWRRRGVGNQMLLRVLGNLTRYPSVGEVYLHVQTSNEDAVRFYKVGSVRAICSRASRKAIRDS